MTKIRPIWRIAASAILLAVLLAWIAPNLFFDAFQSVRPWYLVAGGALLLAGQVLSAYKWLLIVRSEGGDFDIFSAIRIYFIGMFLNIFLPTGLGGDASRVILVGRRANLSVRISTWTVVYDRATGLMALLTITWLAAGWYFFGPVGLLAAIVIGMAVYSGLLSVRRRIEGLITRFWFGRPLKLLLYPIQSRGLTSVAALSFLFNFILITAVFMVVVGFGAGVPWIFVAVTTLVASISLVIPFFVGGYGAREAAFVITLGFVGVESGLAGAIGLSWGLLTSVVGLTGGIMMLTSDKKSKPAVDSGPRGREYADLAE